MTQEEKFILLKDLCGRLPHGDLDKPITRPILTKETANKYFSECVQCAIVSIDENGSIVEILEKNTEPIKVNNNKPKTVKRKI